MTSRYVGANVRYRRAADVVDESNGPHTPVDDSITSLDKPQGPDSTPSTPQPTRTRKGPAQAEGGPVCRTGVVGGGCLSSNEPARGGVMIVSRDRKSTRLNSSHVAISYAVFS